MSQRRGAARGPRWALAKGWLNEKFAQWVVRRARVENGGSLPTKRLPTGCLGMWPGNG